MSWSLELISGLHCPSDYSGVVGEKVNYHLVSENGMSVLKMGFDTFFPTGAMVVEQ